MRGRISAANYLADLQLPEVYLTPFNMGRLSTVDLESNKALGSEMSFIIILEVSPRYSVEPCLDAPAVTLDNDRIPFLPAEEFSPSQGKC